MKAGPSEKLLATLRDRFARNMHRHRGLAWADVEARLAARPETRAALQAMEDSGGEPDVVGRDRKTGECLFVDCAPESPKGRRSACYDAAALAGRKEFKPQASALALAAAMGVELLTEEQYRELQQLEPVDQKSSSWLRTPDEVRKLGGALFGDRRFGRVFTYCNGASSYYAARGFRASLRV